MEPILNWYREEGFILKVVLVLVSIFRIRSSKELLSSGWYGFWSSLLYVVLMPQREPSNQAAPLVAAKMVVPTSITPISKSSSAPGRGGQDSCSARCRVRHDLGGRDIVSVQYQNANNSVRVSDALMAAVEQGKPFWSDVPHRAQRCLTPLTPRNFWQDLLRLLGVRRSWLAI